MCAQVQPAALQHQHGICKDHSRLRSFYVQVLACVHCKTWFTHWDCSDQGLQLHCITFIDMLPSLSVMHVQALAATPANSQERFEARRVLPGMATCLRQVRAHSSLVWLVMLLPNCMAIRTANTCMTESVITAQHIGICPLGNCVIAATL